MSTTTCTQTPYRIPSHVPNSQLPTEVIPPVVPGAHDARERVLDEAPRAAAPVRTATGPVVDAAELWSGGLATAAVAAMVGLVGMLVLRAAFVLLPHGHTIAVGGADTVLLCVVSAGAALAATGLAHALVLSTPEPAAYFGWIVGLATAAAVVLPFVSGAALATALAAAVIHLVVGLAIGTLVSRSVAAATRVPVRRFDIV